MEEIWLYTFENWSIKQADNYLNIILDEIEYLAKNPKAAQDYSKIRKGYYRFRVRSHFIFYRIISTEKAVEIIRILHQRIDIDSRLNQ